jgi:hypothetical protein
MSMLCPAPDHRLVNRRRLLVLSLATAGVLPVSLVSHLPATFPSFERAIDVSRRDAALSRLDPRVIAAVRQRDWFQGIDDRHIHLLEWLAAGHENMGGLHIDAPAVGSTFGYTDLPIVTNGMLDVGRQVDVLNRDMFLFLDDQPVIISSDTLVSANDLESVKRLLIRWFPQVDAMLGTAYPYAGTHIQLNVANSHSRATTRGANIWLAPDFSNLPHAFVHERIHSFQYGPDDMVRFPVFASEGTAEALATLLTGTPAMWHGDGGMVDLELRSSSGGGADYAEQSYNGYQLFADLLRIMGRKAFLSAIQQLYAGNEPLTGAEVLATFRRAAPNAYAVDDLAARSVEGYWATDAVSPYGAILPPLVATTPILRSE